MFDIVGIGNAVVDRTVYYDTNKAHSMDIYQQKGRYFSTTSTEYEQLQHLYEYNWSICAGGSVANSIRTLSTLGFNTAFLGKIGLDEEGKFFENSLIDTGVHSFLAKSKIYSTGSCMIFVHEDKERTICGKAGASKTLSEEDIPEEFFNTKALFFELYNLKSCLNLSFEHIKKAKQKNCCIFLTLSDSQMIYQLKDSLPGIIPLVDVLFGNEYEFKALEELKIMLPLLCFKTKGAQGSAVLKNGIWTDCATLKCKKIINTNGAGDAYAAGVIAGLLRKKNLTECLKFGHNISCQVLGRMEPYLA